MAEVEDTQIRDLVRRLARPRPAGGLVVERAALLAAGSDFEAIETWLLRHGASAEVAAPAPTRSGGLHADRRAGGEDDRGTSGRPASRYVVPADALA